MTLSNSPLWHLYMSRLREFSREPARIFWVYGFPAILAVCLGLAFRSGSQQTLVVDVALTDASTPTQSSAVTPETVGAMLTNPTPHEADAAKPRAVFVVKMHPREESMNRLRTGKTALVVEVLPDQSLVYHFDPTRPEAALARDLIDDALQRARGRKDVISVSEAVISEKGSRYIDFLIPGLIGLNTMGGGLWGIGFLLVNFRKNGLLKRFRATPMPRSHFLTAILAARLTFLIPDVSIMLLLGVFFFEMPVRGSVLLFFLIVIVGAIAFAGIGLLLASRTTTTESVNGLMNLVMLPQWIFSGIFFSSERFPETLQPMIQALPMTQLLNALRAVTLEGANLSQVSFSLAVLLAWGIITFALALRIFQWK